MGKLKTRKKTTAEIVKEETKSVIISCEWNVCSFTKTSMHQFLLHVAEHVATVSDLPTSDGFLCLWRSCGFISLDRKEFDRHIYFHAFHSKIKSIGEAALKVRGLECTLDIQNCNVIPDFPSPFKCHWSDCRIEFVAAQEFYWHVQGHAKAVYKENEDTSNAEYYFKCFWEDCKTTVKASYRLIDHVRTHTKEKFVACPSCGSIFASYNKLYDHCYRNVCPEQLSFECSHCKIKYATESLLREHIRSHVNQFKCPHCEMTCPSKSTMETHIQYRHTNNKPFKCPQCDKRFTVQGDVIKHLVVHTSEKNFICPYPACTYSCRSFTSILLHEKRVHTCIANSPYMCHICRHTFGRGSYLTRHLKKAHDFRWPAGHSRFRYSKDADGFYKLQTTRIESIDLAEEILNEEADRNPDEPRLQIHIDDSSSETGCDSPQVPEERCSSSLSLQERPPSPLVSVVPKEEPEPHLTSALYCHPKAELITRENQNFLDDFLPHPPTAEHLNSGEIFAAPSLVLHDSSQFITLNYNDTQAPNQSPARSKNEEIVMEGPNSKRVKFSAF